MDEVMRVIIGKLSTVDNITGNISGDSKIIGTVSALDNISGHIAPLEQVQGSLSSSGIQKDPYYEVDNTYGTTIYIGE